MSTRKRPGTIVLVGPQIDELYTLLETAARKLEFLPAEVDRLVVQPGGKENLHVPQVYPLGAEPDAARVGGRLRAKETLG